MKENLLTHLQTEYSFSSLEAKKIVYALEAILSEVSKIIILLVLSVPFHCGDQFTVITLVLLSIRCYSGGLHFSHYISCLGFSFLFYSVTILLACCPLPDMCISLGLILSLGAAALTGPVTSAMRPALTPAEFDKYTHRTTFVLLFYSVLLTLWKTLPYRKIIFWVIVLQIFQLLCAHISCAHILCAHVARKGEHHEKTAYAEDL